MKVIKMLIADKGIKQADLAREVGITSTELSFATSYGVSADSELAKRIRDAVGAQCETATLFRDVPLQDVIDLVEGRR